MGEGGFLRQTTAMNFFYLLFDFFSLYFASAAALWSASASDSSSSLPNRSKSSSSGALAGAGGGGEDPGNIPTVASNLLNRDCRFSSAMAKMRSFSQCGAQFNHQPDLS